MADSLLVTREGFDAAVSGGDLATIQAFFTQPHVRTQVEETNARIVETNPTDLATFTRPDGPTPWFCRPTQDYSERIHVPLVDAARKGHVDVIQWFFSADNALRMGATLAFLLPIVGRDRKYMGSEQSDPLVLETLLTSAVFRDAIPLERQQATLDDLARHCDSRLLIDVLVAHGARLDNAQTVIKLYGKQALETTHAFFVGADVLLAPATCWRHAQADDSFLTSRRNSGSGDGDWTDRISRQLIDAARFNNLNAVDALLADGFQDVDARDPLYGMTALMNVAAFDPQLDLSPHTWNDTPSIASALLAYCDVDLVDPLGRTALHYAAERNITVAKVLLEAGADASKRDFLGVAALDYVVDDVYGWRCWPQVMLLFLRGGADPFATRHMPGDCAEEDDLSDQEEADIGAPRSLYDRLMESETGRDFMRTHACYFRGSSLSPAQD
jgi:hypothetical protein